MKVKQIKRPKNLMKKLLKEAVHHPSHYGGADNPYEAIKVMEARMTREEIIGYLKGSVYTYNDRAKYKGNELEDYEKAAWFQNRLVAFLGNYILDSLG